jgi:ketosteroid isomerase-like protein
MMNDLMMKLEERITSLEDRLAISELVAFYGRCVDDRDWQSLADLYTTDGVFDSTGEKSQGRDALISYYQERTSRYSASYHYPHSVEISFHDTGTASGVVCGHAELALEGETVVVAMRYKDQYRKNGDRWQFKSRETQLLYVLKASEIATGFSDRYRVRWPGSPPEIAHIGADVQAM